MRTNNYFMRLLKLKIKEEVQLVMEEKKKYFWYENNYHLEMS